MKTLVLMRHAKSSWDDPVLDDFDRPLNARGRAAAPRMGRWLRQEELIPDLAICSAARRVLDTWNLVAPVLGRQVTTRVEPDLYAADPDLILDTIRSVGEGVETLLVLGHSPGIEDAAHALARDGSPAGVVQRMRRKFPTAAAAVIEFDSGSWAETGPGEGTLVRFVRPRDVPG